MSKTKPAPASKGFDPTSLAKQSAEVDNAAEVVQPEVDGTAEVPPPAEVETTEVVVQPEVTAPAEPSLPRIEVAFDLESLVALHGHVTRGVNFNLPTNGDSRRQTIAAHILWSTLASAGVRCRGTVSGHPDGKVVDNVCDGLRWLLDQLADQIEEQTGKSLISDFGVEVVR